MSVNYPIPGDPGPAGQQGAKGDTGNTGPQGPAGPDGGGHDPVDAAAFFVAIDIATGGEITVDGFATSVGDRVLVNTSTAAGVQASKDAGIYVVALGAWTRATDWAAGDTVTTMKDFVYVRNGDVFGTSLTWPNNNSTGAADITVGTDRVGFYPVPFTAVAYDSLVTPSAIGFNGAVHTNNAAATKLSFYASAAPIEQPILPTDATLPELVAALVELGLIDVSGSSTGSSLSVQSTFGPTLIAMGTSTPITWNEVPVINGSDLAINPGDKTHLDIVESGLYVISVNVSLASATATVGHLETGLGLQGRVIESQFATDYQSWCALMTLPPLFFTAGTQLSFSAFADNTASTGTFDIGGGTYLDVVRIA